MKNGVVFFLFALGILACDTSSTENSGETSTSDDLKPQKDTTLIYLNEQIINDPSNPDVFLARAQFHLELENYANAWKDFDDALLVDSTRTDILFERGEFHFGQQRFENAIADYKSCAEIEPNNTQCLVKLAMMNVFLRNYEDAIAQLNTSLKVDNQLAEAYYLKGRIYKEIGDTTLSASSYQTAIEVDPDYYEAYVEIALLYAKANSDLAMEYNTTAMEIRPRSVEAKYNAAIYLQQTGFRDTARYTRALTLYNEILEIDPNNASAAFNRGFVFLEYRQNYEAAIIEFTKAVELLPNYHQAYYNRGLCYESLNNNEEALKNYNTALTIEPTFTGAAIAKGRVLGE
ncbi:MAG: tetratricopeptide repeat protein [Flavobacteriales bacterium]|nr:tetratricopeptide repeat protein [Flavobacteriales bacterium]MDG1781022.1 tetratricopeptide repeat protein [Flavobacteriales bacterium]MDG2245182.1 tetratricopeptide repeat protein [Flavobacteriales bacterium]